MLSCALSAWDILTDFNFAAQVPHDCPELLWKPNHANQTEYNAWVEERLDNPCAGFHFQLAQTITYASISLPGLMVFLQAQRALIFHLVQNLLGSPRQEKLYRCLYDSLLHCLSIVLMVATLSGAIYLIVVEPIQSKSFPAAGYTFAIITAMFLLGVKFFALIIHAP